MDGWMDGWVLWMGWLCGIEEEKKGGKEGRKRKEEELSDFNPQIGKEKKRMVVLPSRVLLSG